MKRLPLRTALAAVSLATLGACATRDASQAWRIEPLLRVQHSAEASAAFYRTGRYYDGMRRWAQAADEYRKATVADPRNADAFNAMGVALARLGDHTGAENRLRQALALQPDRADVRSNLGLVLMQAGRPAEAVAHLRSALETDKENATARDNLRRALAHGEAAMASMAADPSTANRTAQPPGPEPALAAGLPVLMPGEGESASAPHAVVLPETVPSPAMQVIDRPSVAWRTATPGIATPTRPDVPAPPFAQQTATALPEMRLEISNGNGVPGAAARLRQWLAGRGLVTRHLSNRKPYVQPATMIEYRHGQEVQAQRLAQLLPAQLATQPRTGLRTDVRVLIGHDWQRIAACLADSACADGAVRMAHSGPAY